MKPIQTNRNNNTYSPCRGDYVNVFPTTIFQGKVNLNHTEVAHHCRNIIDTLPKGDPLTEYTTYFYPDAREQTHQQPWYNDFANQMKDTYVEFCRSQYNLDFTDVNRHDIHFFAWVNVYNEPHDHECHNHVKSRLSGTYYVSTQDSSEPIKFWNPNMPALHSQSGNDDEMRPEDSQYEFTGRQHTSFNFHPQDGDFLLWPSYLMHSVPKGHPRENESYERISISFNLQHAEDLESYHHGDQFDYGVLT
tara:strand:+ start:323 stop:1066 length:744 start_codon:yes stop_codon:yes gene_type:complete